MAEQHRTGVEVHKWRTVEGPLSRHRLGHLRQRKRSTCHEMYFTATRGVCGTHTSSTKSIRGAVQEIIQNKEWYLHDICIFRNVASICDWAHILKLLLAAKAPFCNSQACLVAPWTAGAKTFTSRILEVERAPGLYIQQRGPCLDVLTSFQSFSLEKNCILWPLVVIRLWLQWYVEAVLGMHVENQTLKGFARPKSTKHAGKVGKDTGINTVTQRWRHC